MVRVNPDQGMRQILAAPRSSDRRFDPLNMLDVRVAKNFTLYRNVRFGVSVDVFNALNTNTTLGYVSHSLWSSSYQKPSWIPYPRRAQLGLKMEF
jgi:hypothetical protein